jgi:hypothetical protein
VPDPQPFVVVGKIDVTIKSKGVSVGIVPEAITSQAVSTKVKQRDEKQ